MSSFHDGPITVRVPASSANLGPGFDSLGLAVGMFDTVTAEILPSGLVVEAIGEGSADVPRDEGHLIVRSMSRAFEAMGISRPGLRLSCDGHIPHGRGLGSSAAAIVAGVELARSLVRGGDQALSDEATLALASEVEGHPDNVAAAFLGGLTLAWTSEGVGRAIRLEPHGIHPVVFVPVQRSETAAARAALPEQVPHADAAFNASRAALLVLALTGRPELLMTATEDRLHQGYRASGMLGSAALLHDLRNSGIPAVISGAGPTVLALARDPVETARALERRPAGWQGVSLAVASGIRRVTDVRTAPRAGTQLHRERN